MADFRRQLQAWTARELRRLSMRENDLAHSIRRLIDYPPEAESKVPGGRGVLAGAVGVAERFEFVVEVPSTFAFLCYPSSDADDYGWNAAGDPLSSTGYYNSVWYSPIVKVTDSGIKWGVTCLNAGWPYWIGTGHTEETPVTVSVRTKLAYDAAGSIGRTDNIWEDQTDVVPITVVGSTLYAACRVDIGGVPHYRWWEYYTTIKQRPVAGGTTQTITLTGTTYINYRTPAAFSQDGRKFLGVNTSEGNVYEFDIGEATGGSIAGTVVASEAFEETTPYSDTSDGPDRTKVYDTTFRRPIGAGYVDNALSITTLAVREFMNGIYLSSVSIDPNAFQTPFKPNEWFTSVPTPLENDPIRNYIWEVTEWIEQAETERKREMWLEKNGQILHKYITGSDVVLSNNGSIRTGAPDYVTQQSDVLDGEWGNFCGEYINAEFQCTDDYPFSELCFICGADIPNDRVSKKLKSVYDDVVVFYDSIDGAGGLAVWMGQGLRNDNYYYSPSDVDGVTYYEVEYDPTIIAGNMADGLTHNIGSRGSFNTSWNQAISQSDLETKLDEYANILTSSSTTSNAVAKRISTGEIVWSARYSGLVPGQYTEIDGVVPTWMPEGGSLAGHTRRGITEAPCSEE